jgi:hypothetical protein
MNTITKHLVLVMLYLIVSNINAQDTIQKSNNIAKIETLNNLKEIIKNEEREFLKAEVEAINQRLDKGEISQEESEKLKKEAAERRALNIENRLAIIDNKIALLERNTDDYDIEDPDDNQFIIRIGGDEDNSESFIYLGERKYDKPRKYDRRTTSDIVFGIGFNNALIDGQSLDDSPYKLAGSGFVELGYAWKTRIFDESNFWRLKYGFSFQWNKLDIKDNKYLVNTDGVVSIEEFPTNLNKAKFRTTNLVFPVHIEFGPSKKIERTNYFRYSTRNQLKIGLGGYAGFNLGSMQKLKYKENGNKIKNKEKGTLNTSEFVYGLSGYLALGDVALYVKYDLNPIFKNQTVDQNNISVGFRFDMD